MKVCLERGKSALDAKDVRNVEGTHKLLENSTWLMSLLLSSCNNWSGRMDESAAYYSDIFKAAM
jgi:hypothetical protein